VKLTEKIRQHNNSRQVKLQVVICNDLKKKRQSKATTDGGNDAAY